MAGFALGPMPGTSVAEAADIIISETDLPAIPQLPDRGLGSDAVGRTASMLEAINIDRGPRSWRMTARPQLLTRRTWDRLERDLDEVQGVWARRFPTLRCKPWGPGLWRRASSSPMATACSLTLALSQSFPTPSYTASTPMPTMWQAVSTARCTYNSMNRYWQISLLAGFPGLLILTRYQRSQRKSS